MNKDEAISTIDEILELLDGICSDSDLSTGLVLELFEGLHSHLGTSIGGLRYDLKLGLN